MDRLEETRCAHFDPVMTGLFAATAKQLTGGSAAAGTFACAAEIPA
jgi:hypothetical protein